jgi:hypothetical protein
VFWVFLLANRHYSFSLVSKLATSCVHFQTLTMLLLSSLPATSTLLAAYITASLQEKTSKNSTVTDVPTILFMKYIARSWLGKAKVQQLRSYNLLEVLLFID